MGVWLHEEEAPTIGELKHIFSSLLNVNEVFLTLNREKILPLRLATTTGFSRKFRASW